MNNFMALLPFTILAVIITVSFIFKRQGIGALLAGIFFLFYGIITWSNNNGLLCLLGILLLIQAGILIKKRL